MASQMRPLRRANQPPAPSGSQYSSMLASAADGANGTARASVGVSRDIAWALIVASFR